MQGKPEMWKNGSIIGCHFSTNNCQGTFQMHCIKILMSFRVPLKAAGKFSSAMGMVLEGPSDPKINKINKNPKIKTFPVLFIFSYIKVC